MSAPSVEATGTLTADGSEQTLATVAAPRTLVCVVDATNMQVGDVIVLRAYRKVTPGGTQRKIWEEYFGPPSQTGLISAALPSPHSAYFTLQQVGGTNRQYDWSIESL